VPGARLFEDRPMERHSASTTKNLATAATLDELGPGYRPRTPLLRSGPEAANGALEGTMILRA
jgi:D-alanyl-D-alanine carboxypeptidase